MHSDCMGVPMCTSDCIILSTVIAWQYCANQRVISENTAIILNNVITPHT
jgi:hypothetical protein